MRSLPKLVTSLTLVIISTFLLAGCNFNPLERKNKSGLQVITDDIPVSIFVNGEFLGKTPFLTKDLKPGNYELKLEPEDAELVPYETSISLGKGLLTVVTWKPGSSPVNSGGVIYELEKLNNKNDSQVSLISIPDGAIFSIDGGNKEFAPTTIKDITEGNHDLEISLPSYETQKHTINVVSGYKLKILVKLAKAEQKEVDPTPTINRRTDTSNLLATTSGEIKDVTEQLLSSPTPQPLRQPPQEISLATTQVIIESTNFFQNGKEVLRVREASTSASKTIDFAEVGTKYRYLDEESTNWIKIEINKQAGWVSKDYAQLED